MIAPFPQELVEKYACLKIVRGEEVEGLFAQGWVIVATVETGSIHHEFSSIPFFQPGPGGYSTHIQGGVSIPAPIMETKYIMGRTIENGRLVERVAEQSKRIEELEKQHQATKRTLEIEQAKVKDYKLECESANAQYNSERLLRMKLEVDIGKLRKALGERQMNDILKP